MNALNPAAISALCFDPYEELLWCGNYNSMQNLSAMRRMQGTSSLFLGGDQKKLIQFDFDKQKEIRVVRPLFPCNKILSGSQTQEI
ncbi:hypothetical protein ANCDUO_25988 [Ancylostoma duodenale]|uniref:Uncharacterized protein n=1 Tax=Ancylostoma duodenale TaxID=51022 RepID=A0A0C2BJQ5_9BILA|nr:hypothetical protein ANCDUO_25988 [Ancylostoma duodenale]